VGRTPFASQTQGGLTITDEHRDYLVLAADLAGFWTIAGGKVEPQAGDEVREVLDGQTAVFGAMSPGNEPVFTRPGSAGNQLRIHTKRIGAED
jgi:xanthine/CO dehydrogenase XdhC/CoxF family maturation factor